jgi:hypothetical protein
LFGIAAACRNVWIAVRKHVRDEKDQQST